MHVHCPSGLCSHLHSHTQCCPQVSLRPLQAPALTCPPASSNLCRHLNALAYFLPGFCKHLHLQAQCPSPRLFRYLHSHGHCPILLKTPALACPLPALASAGTYTHTPAFTIWSLQAHTVSRPLLLSGQCRHLHSHAHGPHLSPAGSFTLSLSPLASESTSTHSYACCLSLSFRGTCPPMPTAPLWCLQASALTCPPPFSAFYCHLHFYAHCSPLVFPGTCIHIPSASL